MFMTHELDEVFQMTEELAAEDVNYSKIDLDKFNYIKEDDIHLMEQHEMDEKIKDYLSLDGEDFKTYKEFVNYFPLVTLKQC